mgnify:CR=1 FL=1
MINPRLRNAYGKEGEPMQKLADKRRLQEFVKREYRKHEMGFHQLSKKEKEILKRMVLGMDSLEIAQQLFISRQAVEIYKKNIYIKTELRTLQDLVLFAVIFDILL